jgi:hypothetical protein
MDKKELESFMKKNGDTQSTLASFLGITRTCFNKKLNERNGASFTQPEIMAMKRKYNLTADDVNLIFFADCVS